MKIRKKILPVLRPLGDEKDVDALRKTILGGWWGRGPKVEELEKKFAKKIGTKYAVAVTSNTSGIDLVLKAYNINSGNILSPTISFVTTAMVPLWNSCDSKLCDVDKITNNLDPESVKKNMNKKTKAVIAVNYAGIPCDIDKIRKYFKGLIIEDCALSYYTAGAGLKGDVAVWSFQAVKTISCGDGGIITTNSKEIYNRLKLLTNFGIPNDTYQRSVSKNSKQKLRPGYVWDFNISNVGYKTYMNDIQATLLLSQMNKINKSINTRLKIQKQYNAELPKQISRPVWSNTCQFYSTKIENGSRDELMKFLSSKKIHTTIHFKPIHLHSLFKQNSKFRVADIEWKKFISLPCHAAMNQEDIEYVIYWCNQFYN